MPLMALLLLILISVVLIIFLYQKKARQPILVSSLSDVPRLHSIGSTNKIDSIRLQDGKLCIFKSWNTSYVIFATIETKEFNLFLSEFDMDDQISITKMGLQFNEEFLNEFPSWVNDEYKTIYLSNNVVTFEGKTKDAFVSGIFDRETNKFGFMVVFD